MFMCIATPIKLEKVEGAFGFFTSDGEEKRVSLSLIKDPKAGDYILAKGELAISKIDKKQAEEILELIKESSCTC